MYIQDLNICVFIPNYEESYMAKFCGARVIFRGDPVLHHIHYLNHYIVSEFCTTERIPYMTRNLTTVHRNSHKVESYLCECTPHIDTLVCTSPHGGDGVYVEHMSNIRENSGSVNLLMYINNSLLPEGQINQGSVTRVPRKFVFKHATIYSWYCDPITCFRITCNTGYLEWVVAV